MFESTKRFGPISTCHRNYLAEHNPNRDSRKCAWIHGYSRYMQLWFQGDLDERSWVMDFGDLKFVKEWLEENWDHKVLISSSDPAMDLIEECYQNGLLVPTIIPDVNGWGPGIEGSCKWVYDTLNPMVESKTEGRVRISKVEIWEHESNSASYQPRR